MRTTGTKSAVVTGGGSGIGRAVSERLAARGCRVTLADINGEAAERVAAEIRSRGGLADAATVDVCDAAAVERVIREAHERAGRLDYVFNNAGIAIAGQASDMSLDDWQRVLDVDLRGVVHGFVAAYPIMIEQGFGHIVNTASVAGLVPTPTLAAYAAAKHGVVGMSMSLRYEALQHGVKINVVCPGIINTAMKREIELRNLDRGKLDKRFERVGVSVDQCADAILRGVDRDQPMIVVTRHGKALYNLFRLQPRLYGRMLQSGVMKVLSRLRRD